VITLPFSNCRHDGFRPHTRLFCDYPAGSGFGYALRVNVDGQMATLNLPINGEPFGYDYPVVTAVGGAGAKDANTDGGQVLRVDGTSLGPATLPMGSIFPTPVRVFYGGADATVYEAVDCRMVAAGTAGAALLQTNIVCETAPGTGRGHALAVEVAGRRSEVPFVNQPDGLTYGAPVLASFSSPADAPAGSNVVSAADTAGQEEILINGRNFGEWTERIMVQFFKQISLPLVSDGSAGSGALTASQADRIRFLPETGSCVVTVPHRQISCIMGQGAGNALDWMVQVDGLNSSNPVTAYSPPVISSVHPVGALSSPVSPQGLSSEGGVRLSISGRYFGPSGSSFNGNPGLVQRIAYAVGGVTLAGQFDNETASTSTGQSYAPVTFSVVSHNRIDVTLPPSIGTGHCFGLLVADQEAIEDPATQPDARCFDFALPEITSLTPRRAPTDPNGATMVIQGTNLGLRDPIA